MLSDQFYRDAERAIAELYGSLEDDIIRDIARRIVKNDGMTDTAVWQSAKLQEAGLVYDDVIAEIAKVSGKAEKEIKKLFREASVEALAYDDQIYQLAGIQTAALKQSPALLKVLEAGFLKTSGLLHNLTMTTANMTQVAYINACDTAYMQIASGAFAPQTAIKNAVIQASKTGAFVLYPTGHRDRLDVAIRRATLTGLTQTTQQLQWQRMDDLEVDLVEVSAHAGARPSHAAWQGRIYSRSGRSGKYPDFVSSTGYGSGAGLGGWNCRHSFYPYFDGISQPAYSEQDLQNYQQMNSFEYDGKSYTQYEGTQQQRAYERAIRSTKRELVGLDEALKHAETDNLKAELQSEFEKKSVKLKGQEAKLKDFLAASKQRNERDRQQIIGFNRSVSSKAVWAAKKPTLSPFDAKHLAKQDAEKLPNYQKAVIPKEKLEGYALNKNHPTGRDKAVAFEKYLGYTTDNQEELISQVRQGLEKYKAKGRKATQYGKPYEVSMVITGANGKTAKVKSGWIVDKGGDIPRLVSIYVDE